MSRRDNGHNRCPTCALHLPLCICDQLPRLKTASRLLLILHRNEARKPTNTGQLAARCLMGSEVLVHGMEGERAPLPPHDDEGERAMTSLLLYPDEEAEVLSSQHLSMGPIRLVVPDGNWRQAAKMTRRIPWVQKGPLSGLSVIGPSSLPKTNRSCREFFLFSPPESTTQGLLTDNLLYVKRGRLRRRIERVRRWL
jgi:DTW domain-containing protein YfiP